MNADLKIDFKTNYHIELIDSKSGAIKQSGDFHNIPVVGMTKLLTQSGNQGIEQEYTTWGTYGMFSTLRLGSGSTEPKYTDTALASQLWAVQKSSLTSTWLSDHTIRGTAVFEVPASASYVGTVREVGLACTTTSSYSYDNPNAYMCTRALLTDSEGSPISFIKTDTDILKVTVTADVTLASSNSGFKIFKHPFYLYAIIGSWTTSSTSGAFWGGKPSLNRFANDMKHFVATGYITTGREVAGTSYCYYSNTSAYLRFPVARLLATDVTGETYYKGVAITGIGYFDLPNEDIFPAYTITAVPIGTGDGSTTKFSNPLCYFKKDTEKVYKNGVQLTRGVDYTISNIANGKGLPEIAENEKLISVHSDDEVTQSSYTLYPLIRPSNLAGGNLNAIENKPSLTFSNANPLYIEYSEPVTINHFKCTGNFIQWANNRGYTIPVGTKLFLDYSTDGTSYDTACEFTVSVAGNTSFAIDFDDATAQYWRVRTSSSASLLLTSGYFIVTRIIPYIEFTNAPADGDVLTMDVNMDLIMKNSNFVVDIGCRLDFSV